MKTEMRIALQISVALLVALVWISIPVFASGGDNGCDYDCDGGEQPPIQSQEQDQHQEQGQSMGQGQEQAATATSDAMSTSGSSASNEGISMDASDNSTTNVENNSSNIVLVPNNNTENCLRVFGIAWGKGGESGALGIPWRSKKCDYEQAADDAFAQGEREIGWFWKCENPNLYKSFKGKGESQQSASKDCLDRMLGGLRATTTITTMTQTIETLEEQALARQALYEKRERELRASCSEEKNRMLAACIVK